MITIIWMIETGSVLALMFFYAAFVGCVGADDEDATASLFIAGCPATDVIPRQNIDLADFNGLRAFPSALPIRRISATGEQDTKVNE